MGPLIIKKGLKKARDPRRVLRTLLAPTKVSAPAATPPPKPCTISEITSYIAGMHLVIDRMKMFRWRTHEVNIMVSKDALAHVIFQKTHRDIGISTHIGEDGVDCTAVPIA